MGNKIARVNLFEFSLGIGIDIENERYNLINANAEGILQMVENYDIDELVLVGPKIITSKYERDIVRMMNTTFNKNYKITTVEG